jgi:hypothetical protein
MLQRPSSTLWALDADTAEEGARVLLRTRYGLALRDMPLSFRVTAFV